MPDLPTSPVAARFPFQAGLWATGLFFLSLLLIYHQTTWSMIAIWLRSETFTHGFIILPISLWLVWNKWDQLRAISPKPVLWIALLMIPPGFVWLLAWLVDVLVVQQLALVTMVVVGAWAIMGHELTRSLAFPLLFLFFAVPMGEALVPPMMEFTATSTVWMIQQTGIPVYREGLYFMLPSGNWSVVEACSGVRYVIASVTLGVLYAYLTYRSFWRQALFVLASVIVPVLANSVRAYMIVMLGHLSNMTVATGVDHLIYGWVFFGLVIFLLFWLGSFWREDGVTASDAGSAQAENPGESGAGFLRLLTGTLVALLAAAVWPLLAYTIQSGPHDPSPAVAVKFPDASGAWRMAPEPDWHWQLYSAVADQVASYYVLDGKTLGLFIQYADGTSQGGEVVGSSARFADPGSGRRVITRDKVTMLAGGEAVLVDQALLRGNDDQLLVWSWYRIGDLVTSNDYLAKFRETWASLGLGSSGSYRIVVAMPLQGSDESTQALLQDFFDAHGNELDAALDRAMEGGQPWIGTATPH